MNNSTPRILRAVNRRREQALWYAYGSLDTWTLTSVDANEFATWAAEQVRDVETGVASFVPSIQEQWRVYLWQKTHPEGR